MSEWQPARINPVHGGNWAVLVEEIKKRIMHIRPTDRVYWPSTRKKLGCDATKFYELHPDDVFPGCGDLVCEHEILTD